MEFVHYARYDLDSNVINKQSKFLVGAFIKSFLTYIIGSNIICNMNYWLNENTNKNPTTQGKASDNVWPIR